MWEVGVSSNLLTMIKECECWVYLTNFSLLICFVVLVRSHYMLEKNVYPLPAGLRNLRHSSRSGLNCVVKIFYTHAKFLLIWFINYWEWFIKIFHCNYVLVKFLQEFCFFLLLLFWEHDVKFIPLQNDDISRLIVPFVIVWYIFISNKIFLS